MSIGKKERLMKKVVIAGRTGRKESRKRRMEVKE